MSTHVHQPSVVHHQNKVGILNGLGSVSGIYSEGIGSVDVNFVHNSLFHESGQCIGHLIEKEDFGIPIESSGYEQSLFLSSTEIFTAVTYYGSVGQGHALYIVAHLCHFYTLHQTCLVVGFRTNDVS